MQRPFSALAVIIRSSYRSNASQHQMVPFHLVPSLTPSLAVAECRIVAVLWAVAIFSTLVGNQDK
jgi:hypothetical protein